MGVYRHYQAMPEDSQLARRLRTERPLCVLYTELIHRPAGPYDTARLQSAEREEHLTEIAGNPLFGSRAVVDRVYADLQAELARAANEFPGLPDRATYFKLQDFDQQLAQVLAGIGRADADALVKTLVWGAGPFVPEGFGTSNVQLCIVSPSRVAEAAGLLQSIDPELFDGWEEEWEAFRGVYVEAAARSEAIVIA